MTGKPSQRGGASTVKIRKRRAFSAIPDDILEDKRMRTETRLVLGWLIGRPDGWVVRVRHVMAKLGLSEGRWKTSRREMEKFGYLHQARSKASNGTFVWEHTISDAPVIGLETIGDFCTDGSSTGDNPADITTSFKQEELNTPSPYPFPDELRLTQACIDEAHARFLGYSVEELEKVWRESVARKGTCPKYPDRAFLAWADIYVKNHPLPYGGTF